MFGEWNNPLPNPAKAAHREKIDQLLDFRCRTLNVEIAQLELELAEVVHHPEQLGRELIIEKELSNKKADVKLWKKKLKG